MNPFEKIHTLLWILIFIIFSNVNLSAQNCDGLVGEQLFFDDFGSGAGPGPALPAGITTYNYGNIGGGNYVVTNTTGINGTLWHNAPDHTPNDVNGYCLLFDASFNPGIFYNRLFENLCPNTNYSFSCYVANISRPFTCGGNSIEPNIRFSLLDPSTAMELGAVSTGGIATTEEMTWNQYSITFRTNPGQEDILIQIINNANGGCGNDLAIDDFSFNICNPTLYQEFDLCTLPNNMVQVGTEIYSSPGEYETLIDLPNSCHDSIVYTTIAADQLSNINQYFIFCPGDSVAVNGTFYSSDTILIDTIPLINECFETITFIIEEGKIETTSEIINLCQGDSIFILGAWTAEEGIYQDTLLSDQGCDSLVTIDLQLLEFNLDLNVSQVTLFPGEGIELMAASNIEEAAFQWMPPEFFSCSSCATTNFSSNQSGIYSLLGNNPMTGCRDSISFAVEVKPCGGSFFPNVFSPNNDGVNDYYRPFLSPCIARISTFQIYDRWGGVMHIQNDIPANEARWDGQFKFKDVVPGVYAFFLNTQMFDGSTRIYKGDITVLR